MSCNQHRGVNRGSRALRTLLAIRACSKGGRMQDNKGSHRTRREILAAVGASSLALVTGTGFAARPTIAQGHVFHDRRETGKRSVGDPGIPGVMVSNGRDVVLTDSEGRWRLSIADGDSIFLI